MKKFVCVLSVVMLFSVVASAEPTLYFADVNGNAISQISATPGEDITVYVYGQVDAGNVYDNYNVGLSYDKDAILPLSGITQTPDGEISTDINLSIQTEFTDIMVLSNTVYNNNYILVGSAGTGMLAGAPEFTTPTLLTEAYFTYSGGITTISMFNEEFDYSNSTFFLATDDLSEVRFSDTLTIVPEPMTMGLVGIGLAAIVARRRRK